MRTRSTRARIMACALAAAALAPAATAQAGAPGTWTKVTGIEVAAHNTDELGLFRTADGVLHIAYVVAPGGGAPESVMHRALAKDAKSLAGPDTVATQKTMNNRVALVAGPVGGLRVFYAGLVEGETASGFMKTSTSDAAGKAWTIGAPASNNTTAGVSPVYAATGLSAVVGFDGTPTSIWGDSAPGGGGIHAGLDPSAPDFKLGGPCCAVDPALTIDGATGQLVAGWNLVGDGIMQVQALGGAKVTVPASGAAQTQQRVGLTGRGAGKPGVYLAYITGTNPFLGRPALWKVGDPAATVIPGPRGAQHIGISPTADGRLWLFWTRNGRVLATRTNKSATKLGALVSIKPPAGGDTVFRLNGDGSPGFLDVLGLFQKGGSDLGYWQQRILPGLTLTASPTKVKAGQKFTFKVTDAGDAVAGVTVSLKVGSTTVSGSTAATGKVKLKVPAGARVGKYTARAAKAGYVGASAKVRVKA